MPPRRVPQRWQAHLVGLWCVRLIHPRLWLTAGNHIEQALAGVPEADRCHCPHEPVDGNPSMKEVKKRPEAVA